MEDPYVRRLVNIATIVAIACLIGTLLLLSTYTPPSPHLSAPTPTHQSSFDPREFAVQQAKAAVLNQANRAGHQSGGFSSSNDLHSGADDASWSSSGDDSGNAAELFELLYGVSPLQSDFTIIFTVPITTFQPEK